MRLRSWALLSLPLALATGAGAAAPATAAAVPTNTVFLASAINFDRVGETVTLPLHHGFTPSGGDAWYIVTESSNQADATARGVNFSHRLGNAIGTKAVQNATVMANGELQFAGTVDFSGKYEVVPSSPDGFPPTTAIPGAVGDSLYSPYVTAGTNGIVLNASQVANSSGQHAFLQNINFAARTVTLNLFEGFYDHHPILYLRLDASIPLVAAIEGSNFAPNLNAAPGEGTNSESTSRLAIIPIVNGPRGINNPQRQGLESALLGEGAPRNVTQAKPTDAAYSPVWDVTPTKWTADAVAKGQVKQLTKDTDVAKEFVAGRLFSFGSGPANSSLSGIQALGAVSNCPIVAELD